MTLNANSNRYRLSHSTFELFHTCERRFQLERLLVGENSKEDTTHTVFGKAFGEGVATYMLTQDSDKALFKAFMAYEPLLEDSKKNLTICLNLLAASFSHLDDLLLEWEVASFNGKPAVELSFNIDIDPQFYYVGYIDIVLRNRYSGRYAIMENKTTGLQLLDLSPLYQNSGQALGYSIILDKIVGKDLNDYDVLYFVGQLGKDPYTPQIKPLTFPKNINDRLNWFITIGLDVERIKRMLELNVFPLRGKSCLNFMKACPHLGTCQLHALDQYKEIPPDEIEYDFHFHLDSLIEDHINRINIGV